MIVKAITPHGERLLFELRRNGDIQIEQDGIEKLPVGSGRSFADILQEAQGSISREEGEALRACLELNMASIALDGWKREPSLEDGFGNPGCKPWESLAPELP